MRMFVPGTAFTAARILFPRVAGKPRKSELTMATRVVPSSRTSARTVNSPALLVTGAPGPIPPTTGSKGSGVTFRTAIAARKSAHASSVDERMNDKAKRVRFMVVSAASHRKANATCMANLIHVLKGFDSAWSQSWPPSARTDSVTYLRKSLVLGAAAMVSALQALQALQAWQAKPIYFAALMA